MRLVGRPVSLEKQLKVDAVKSGAKLELNLGDRLRASIVDVDGEKVVLRLAGRLIEARNASSEKLFSGMDTIFEVVKSSEYLIEIRPAALSQMSTPETDLEFAKGILLKMGVPITEENLEILMGMVKAGSLLSKGKFDASKTLFRQVQKLSDFIFKEGGDNPVQKDTDVPKRIFQAFSKPPFELLKDREVLNLLSSISKDIPLALGSESVDASKAEIVDKKQVPDNSEQVFLKGDNLEEGLSKDGVGISKTSEGLNTDVKGVEAETEKSTILKFLSAFKTVSSDRGELLKSIFFLSKINVKPSLMNIAITQGMLKGDNGFSEAVFNLSKDLGSEVDPSLKDAINLFKEGLLSAEKLENIDAEDLKNLLKAYDNLNKSLENAQVLDDSKSTSQTEILQQNSALAKDMQPAWSSIALPFISEGKIEDIEIYVKKDGGGSSRKGASSDKLVYLSLKTDNMDRIKVRIDYKPQLVNLVFLTKGGDIEEYVRTQVESLGGRLKEFLDKDVNISVNSDFDDVSLIGFEHLGSVSSVSRIDFKV